MFWGSFEEIDAINEALLVWQAMTGEFTRSFLVPVVNGTVFYDVPKQIASIQRILFNNTPLQMLSLWELDNGYVGWQTATGTPLYWTPVALNIFALYPSPTSGFLVIEGFSENVRITSDADQIDLGNEELTRIIDYARHYSAFKEGAGEFQSSMGAFKRFMEAAGLRNSRFRATNTYRRAMGIQKDENERPMQVTGAEPGVRNRDT